FKNIIICHCGVLLILIVDLGRSLSTDYTALFSFHTPEMIIALRVLLNSNKFTKDYRVDVSITQSSFKLKTKTSYEVVNDLVKSGR
ncbi:MAG: hypothetical protein LM517_09925, partial [Nitrosomonas sp.]|nr:hypothetical protein [Nitrosomonas sp.]